MYQKPFTKDIQFNYASMFLLTMHYALVKYGGGIVQMSGSIAGTTHARNRFGNYARARTKPVNPNTAAQQVVRATMAFLTDRWAQTLTLVQRTAWDLYASNVAMKNRLGETVFLTGFNHYIRSNSPRKNGGLTVIDDGPVIFELPAADPVFSITASEAAQTYDYAFDNTLDWATEDLAHLLCFQGSPQNPQRNFFAGPWSYRGRIDGAALGAPASPVTKGIKWPFSEGQHLWSYGRISRADGRLSSPFRDDTYAIA